ncbi:MAG: hypothetical protein ACI4RA_04640 [Kiritimatiellia bacterium]
MKYTYAYKTSDGIRHEDVICASSREEVFTALRAKGIKAIKVVAADGSKANGEVHSVRKRVMALSIAVVALVVGGIAYFLGTRTVEEVGGLVPSSEGETDSAQSFLTNTTRRQVIGDAAIIERGIRTGWADVFEQEGDRFLASFAIPGVKAGQRNTTEELLLAALNSKHQAPNTPTLEARQIIAMVEGMKEEARAYIKAGGTAVEYGKRLTERQDAEIAIFKRVADELAQSRQTMSEEAFTALYEQRNDELRNLGIKPVVLNED